MDSGYLHIFFFTFASLFSITNPIGMSTVFLAVTQHETPEKQKRIAKKVGIYSLALLVATFFIGPYVLDFFGISLSSVQIAGGILVFHAAWGILNSKAKIDPQARAESLNEHADKNSEKDSSEDSAFFPLTMPLTAGAGAMAVTISLASSLKTNQHFTFLSIFTCLLATVLVCILIWISYRHARNIFNFLGNTGANVVTRLTAFILLSIGVTMIFDGLTGLIKPLITLSH